MQNKRLETGSIARKENTFSNESMFAKMCIVKDSNESIFGEVTEIE